MFDKVFRILDYEYTEGHKQINIHVEGQTVEECKDLFDYVLEAHSKVVEKCR